MSFVIKKEDIKDDIIVNFDDNFVYTDGQCNPFVHFENGMLVISIQGYYIFEKNVLESYKLKKDYLDRFKLDSALKGRICYAERKPNIRSTNR